MRFRIAELKQEDKQGNRFFIEKGVMYHETGIFGIKFQQTAWAAIMGTDHEPLATKTFDEAVLIIKELKKQMPTYHHVE